MEPWVVAHTDHIPGGPGQGQAWALAGSPAHPRAPPGHTQATRTGWSLYDVHPFLSAHRTMLPKVKKQHLLEGTFWSSF